MNGLIAYYKSLQGRLVNTVQRGISAVTGFLIRRPLTIANVPNQNIAAAENIAEDTSNVPSSSEVTLNDPHARVLEYQTHYSGGRSDSDRRRNIYGDVALELINRSRTLGVFETRFSILSIGENERVRDIEKTIYTAFRETKELLKGVKDTRWTYQIRVSLPWVHARNFLVTDMVGESDVTGEIRSLYNNLDRVALSYARDGMGDTPFSRNLKVPIEGARIYVEAKRVNEVGGNKKSNLAAKNPHTSRSIVSVAHLGGNYCKPASLVVLNTLHEEGNMRSSKKYKELIRKDAQKTLKNECIKLMFKAGINFLSDEAKELIKNDDHMKKFNLKDLESLCKLREYFEGKKAHKDVPFTRPLDFTQDLKRMVNILQVHVWLKNNLKADGFTAKDPKPGKVFFLWHERGHCDPVVQPEALRNNKTTQHIMCPKCGKEHLSHKDCNAANRYDKKKPKPCGGCQRKGLDHKKDWNGKFYASCYKCRRSFRTKECFDMHLEDNVCESMYYCKHCKVFINKHFYKKAGYVPDLLDEDGNKIGDGLVQHDCHHELCTRCDEQYPKNTVHSCKVHKPKKFAKSDEKLGVLDYETLVHKFNENGASELIPYLLCFAERDALDADGHIADQSKVHDFRLTKEDLIPHTLPDGTYSTNIKYIVTQKFMDFLFQVKEQPRGSRKRKRGGKSKRQKKQESPFDGYKVFAHFGRGFDFQFILDYCLQHNIGLSKETMQGTVIYTMKCHKNGASVQFRDSHCHIVMPLRKAAETFSADLAKGFLPHAFVTLDRWVDSYVGPYPELTDNAAWHMDTATKEGYEALWKAMYPKIQAAKIQGGEQFHLVRDAIEYCRTDVLATFQVLMSYRKKFMDNVADGRLDICQYNTLSATTSALWRTIHMEKFSVEQTTPLPDRHSIEGAQWIIHCAETHGLDIQHGYGHRKEARLVGASETKHKVDGFLQHEDKSVIYQYHGCTFHGCPSCFKVRDEIEPVTGLTHQKNYEKTMAAQEDLEDAGYQVETMWSCQWKEVRKTLPNVVHMDRLIEHKEPHVRDALFGGMVGPTRLFSELDELVETFIKYDVSSMYAAVQKYCYYPKGSSKFLRYGCPAEDLDQYFGVAKVKLLPPKTLFVPLIPSHVMRDGSQRNVETLCRTCAEECNQGDCHHTDEERQLVGVYATPLIEMAVSVGYEVKEVMWLQYWEEKDNMMFKKYIDLFYNLKSKAEKDGDEGLRAIAKQWLCSLWGKLCQALLRSICKRVDTERDLDECFKKHKDAKMTLFTGPETAEVMAMNVDDYLNPGVTSDAANDFAYVEYTENEEDLKNQDYSGNAACIGVFTTAYARMHLYKMIHYLGFAVHYVDTDSVTYKYSPDTKDVPAPGKHLDFTRDDFETDEEFEEARQQWMYDYFSNHIASLDTPPPMGDQLGEWAYDHLKDLVIKGASQGIEITKVVRCETCDKRVILHNGPESVKCASCESVHDYTDYNGEVTALEVLFLSMGKKSYLEAFKAKTLLEVQCGSCTGIIFPKDLVIPTKPPKKPEDFVPDGVTCPYCRNKHGQELEYADHHCIVKMKGEHQTLGNRDIFKKDSLIPLVLGAIDLLRSRQAPRLQRKKFKGPTEVQIQDKMVRITAGGSRRIVSQGVFVDGVEVMLCERLTLPFGFQ